MSAFPTAGGTTSASTASMPALLEGHRLDVRISRRGRDDLRVVRLNASTVGGAASRCPHFPPREGRPPRRPPQCQHCWRGIVSMSAFPAAGGTTSASSASSALRPRPVRKHGKLDCLFCTTTGRFDPHSLQGRRPRCLHWAEASSVSPRLRVNILHKLTALFRSNQLLRNLRFNSSALPTS